jgi:putative membrane protein
MKNEEKRGFVSKRTLILNVDRDNDIGVKAGVKTPLIGKEALLDAAVKLLLNDPEEADGNALFAAVKIYESYEVEEGEAKEVAAITGSEVGGIEADRKLIRELNEVLNHFPADNIILVTDGFADEEVIPIIDSRVPILSIQHVVVKHSESVEETYAILGRYLKMLWNEMPYRMYFVALPGIIVTILGILMFLQLTGVAIAFTFIIAGIAMIVKGFGVDDYISNLSKAPFSEYIRLASYVISFISLFVGLYLSYLSVAVLPEFKIVMENPSLLWEHGVQILTSFMPPFLLTILVTMFIYVLGLSLYCFVTERYYRIIRYLLLLEATLIIYIAGNEANRVLIEPKYGFSNLIIFISIGLLILSVTIIIVYLLAKKRRQEIESEVI